MHLVVSDNFILIVKEQETKWDNEGHSHKKKMHGCIYFFQSVPVFSFKDYMIERQ